MLVSYVYLIFIVVMTIKGDLVNESINYLLAVLIVLIASGIISICSRLDDLKRK